MKKKYYTLFCALAGMAVLGAAPVAPSGTAAVPDTGAAVSETDADKMPVYEGKKEYSAEVSKDINITLSAAGEKPMIFEAEDLPADLTLDLKTGVISGKIGKAGDYPFSVVITNKSGTTRVQITLKVK